MSCPMCRKPMQADYKPFCSRRCADLDLGNWLTGNYVSSRPLAEGDLADHGLDDDSVDLSPDRT